MLTFNIIHHKRKQIKNNEIRYVDILGFEGPIYTKRKRTRSKNKQKDQRKSDKHQRTFSLSLQVSLNVNGPLVFKYIYTFSYFLETPNNWQSSMFVLQSVFNSIHTFKCALLFPHFSVWESLWLLVIWNIHSCAIVTASALINTHA